MSNCNAPLPCAIQKDKLHFTNIDNAWLFTTTGLTGFVVQTFLLQSLLAAGDEKHIILLGLTANAIHMVGYAVSWEKWCMYVVEGRTQPQP